MSKTSAAWLSYWAVLVSVFGLILAGGAFAPTDKAVDLLFGLFGAPLPAIPDQHHRFSIGLMGAVTVGWGLTLLVAFRALNALGPGTAAPFWRQISIAVAIWYVIDNYISIATGFWPNAVSNTLLVVLYGVAIARSGVLKADQKSTCS